MFKDTKFSEDGDGYIVFVNYRNIYFTNRVHVWIMYNEDP